MSPSLFPDFSAPTVAKPAQLYLRPSPPQRHYLWVLQQLILMQLLSGASLNTVARQHRPSRKTIKRWFDQLKSRYALDASALCSRFAELGRANGFIEFWTRCLQQMDLSKAMTHLFDLGIIIP